MIKRWENFREGPAKPWSGQVQTKYKTYFCKCKPCFQQVPTMHKSYFCKIPMLLWTNSTKYKLMLLPGDNTASSSWLANRVSCPAQPQAFSFDIGYLINRKELDQYEMWEQNQTSVTWEVHNSFLRATYKIFEFIL